MTWGGAARSVGSQERFVGEVKIIRRLRCSAVLLGEIEVSCVSDPQTPLPSDPKSSGKPGTSLPAVLSGSFCVVAALWLVVSLSALFHDDSVIVSSAPPVLVTFKVHWEDTELLNVTRDAEASGQVAYQDNGYA